MNIAVKKASLFLAQCYALIWLMLPNLMLLYVYNEALPPLHVFLVVLAVSLLLYFYLFPSFRWFGLFNIPFALFSGAYTGYIFVYKSIPYEGMWFSIWDMVYLEIVDLGSYYADLIMLNLVGFALYLVAVLSLERSTATGHRKMLQKPVLLGCTLVILLTLVGQNFFSDRIDMGHEGFGASFIQSYPLGMAFQAYSTWNQSKQHEQIESSEIPELKRVVAPLAGKELYILVIGETARSDRWLADLEANDFANLESKNTVLFPDAYSQANFTDGSLHLLLTGADTFQQSEGTATLPLLARGADCQTIWISNNKAYRYSWQADYSVITEQTTSTPLVKRFDHAMLPAIYRAIKQSSERACLVIHLLGSHFSYKERYPLEFKLKNVNLAHYQDKNSAGHVTALRNAYDNSIHATNDFLEQLIGFVDQQSVTSFVMYTADHGENLYDDERELFQHIMITPSHYEVHVPFFVWANDSFISNFPDKWTNLVNNGKRPISNKQILPTFVDLLGVDYQQDHFSASLLSNYPDDPTRFVLSPHLRLLSSAHIR